MAAVVRIGSESTVHNISVIDLDQNSAILLERVCQMVMTTSVCVLLVLLENSATSRVQHQAVYYINI